MINYFRSYLKNAAQSQAALNDYLKGAKKRDKRKIQWTEEAKLQFQKCKQDLSDATLLAFPDPDAPLGLFTDASDTAVGAALQQFEKNQWRPIAFFSKKLNAAQKAYSTYDRELLGIYLAVKQCRQLLEGREFTIFTDHKPITFAFKQKNEKASPRQSRQLQYVSQFSTDVRHINGKDNVVADTLSRTEEISIIDFSEIADSQESDNDLKEWLSNSESSLRLKKYPLAAGKTLWCDTTTDNIRPYLPKAFRFKMFKQIHDMAHPGVRSTVKQITSKFVWPGIQKDVRNWSRSCIECQRNKTTRHTKAPLSTFETPDERFAVIHVDLVGPWPTSDGKSYCLTMIDRFTSWMEVVPLRDITAETVARALYENWITRFGVPCQIITDQGRQFESQLFRNLAAICGARVQHTTAYHPQCNGKIERLHRTLKAAIRAHKSARWTEVIPTVLLGLRAALKEGKQHTIAQMVYGKTIKLPGEFFDQPRVKCNEEAFTSQLQRHMDLVKPMPVELKTRQSIFVHKDLKSCSHVFVRIDRVRKPLEPTYDGPYEVLSRNSKFYSLRIKGNPSNISIDRLKPAYRLATADDSVTPDVEAHADDGKSQVITTRYGRLSRKPDRYASRVAFSPAANF